jgi:hypothetical protein
MVFDEVIFDEVIFDEVIIPPCQISTIRKEQMLAERFNHAYSLCERLKLGLSC